MIDRNIAPEIHAITKIHFPEVNRQVLSNGTPLYVLASGQQEVAKVEVVFYAGRWQESHRGVASAVAALLKEGTTQMTSLEIANLIDYYGASIQVRSLIDYASVTLFCLTKHLDFLLPLMAELICDASFEESELELYARNQKQKIEVNEKKVEYLGQRLFTEKLYGATHPLGYTTSVGDLLSLKREQLLNFKQQFYTHQNAFILASGKLNDEHLNLINRYLGVSMNQHKSIIQPEAMPDTTNPGLYTEEKVDAMQSAIRVGKRFIGRMHPDYPLVKAANLIFGEYFGSRLMSNLREDKGFCYGVYSSIASFLNDAYLCIATEVGVDSTEQALLEIDHELIRLQNDLVKQDELQAAINYRMGVFLSDLDGAFNQHDYLKGLLLFGADKEYAMRYIDTLRGATPQQIQDMAQKYYSVESFIKVVAGKNIKTLE